MIYHKEKIELALIKDLTRTMAVPGAVQGEGFSSNRGGYRRGARRGVFLEPPVPRMCGRRGPPNDAVGG